MLFFYRDLFQINFMFTMICFVMKMKYLVILSQNLMKVSLTHVLLFFSQEFLLSMKLFEICHFYFN